MYREKSALIRWVVFILKNNQKRKNMIPKPTYIPVIQEKLNEHWIRGDTQQKDTAESE